MDTKKIENIVLSIEQAKHLKKLGYEIKNNVFTWQKNLYTKETRIDTFYQDAKRSLRTLTLQEILEILPCRITIDGKDYDLEMSVSHGNLTYFSVYGFEYLHTCEGGTPLDVAYNMLCWVVEKGFFKQE